MNINRPAWERFLPGIAVLRRYERGWLSGDVIAGVTVAAYLVPQVMAYAVIAGLPAVAGLWATVKSPQMTAGAGGPLPAPGACQEANKPTPPGPKASMGSSRRTSRVRPGKLLTRVLPATAVRPVGPHVRAPASC